MKSKVFGIAAFFIVVSCGVLRDREDAPDNASSISALKSVSTISDLSGCWPNIEGEMRYISSENKIVVCLNKEWKYIEFGAASAASLIRTDNVQPGSDCEFGGKLIAVGSDDGQGRGEPNDGVLSDDEIDSKQYLCREGLAGLFVADPVTGQPFASVFQIIDSSLVVVKSLGSKYMTIYHLSAGSLSIYPNTRPIYYVTPDCSGQPYMASISFDMSDDIGFLTYQDYFLHFQKFLVSKETSTSLNFNSQLSNGKCQTYTGSAIQSIKLEDSGFVFPKSGKIISR